MIHANQTLAHVATTQPAAVHVFLRHRLDFCCGGGQKLSNACLAAGLDPQTVIAEIVQEAAAPTTERWDTKPLPDLIDFIVERFHNPLRRDLPALVAAAKKVERVHANKPNCPHGLAAHLEQVDAEVQQHLDKEEQVLFPAIQVGGQGAQIQMPIRVLMQEHDDHGVNLHRMRELATQFVPPPEACGTWRGLYAGLAKLEADLMKHIHLENNILFPRALDIPSRKVAATKATVKAGIVGVVVAILLLAIPNTARAHCDSLDGPVVTDAKATLKSGHVDGVLKWISAEQETEVRAAFANTLKVRTFGDQARDLADTYFFETLVRLHRATEDAPYTGLQAAGSTVEPGVDAADRALGSGSSDRVARGVARTVQNGIKHRFERAAKLKKIAERSAADGRRYVAAYVDYIHYVRRLHLAATSDNAHEH